MADIKIKKEALGPLFFMNINQKIASFLAMTIL